jgi:mutator protein MutT
MIQGRDYIGVGVGALVFNEQGQVFLAQRGGKATNERGAWEFPGGKVTFGETLIETIQREFIEEYGMQIEVLELLGVNDHILPEEGQHWVSPTYIARHVAGTPTIREPEKCLAIDWFSLDALPKPLSQVTQEDLKMLQKRNTAQVLSPE